MEFSLSQAFSDLQTSVAISQYRRRLALLLFASVPHAFYAEQTVPAGCEHCAGISDFFHFCLNSLKHVVVEWVHCCFILLSFTAVVFRCVILPDNVRLSSYVRPSI